MGVTNRISVTVNHLVMDLISIADIFLMAPMRCMIGNVVCLMRSGLIRR